MIKIIGSTSLLLASPRALAESKHSCVGISAQTPTSLNAISADGLAAAYDFETYTNDGLLKDFGPFQIHGTVQQTQEADGLFGKARVFKTLKDVADIPENDREALA